jgi:hypothetical protein
VPLRQVVRERDLAARRIDQARCAEHDSPYSGQRSTGSLGRLDDRGVHDLHRVVRLTDQHVGPPDNFSGDIGGGGDNVLRPDVHSDDVCGRRHHGVHLGVRPATTGLLADPADQPALLEPLHELRGGDLRQAGQLAELGAGQRTACEQQLKCGTIIEGAKQARRTRQPCGAHQAGLMACGIPSIQ